MHIFLLGLDACAYPSLTLPPSSPHLSLPLHSSCTLHSSPFTPPSHPHSLTLSPLSCTPHPSPLHSSLHIPHTQTSTSILILTPRPVSLTPSPLSHTPHPFIPSLLTSHPSHSNLYLTPHPHSTPLTLTVSLTPLSLSPPPGVPVPAVVSSPGGELALRLHFEAEHSNVLVVTAELLNGCLSRCEVHSMKMELLQDMYPHFPVSCCVPEQEK